MFFPAYVKNCQRVWLGYTRTGYFSILFPPYGADITMVMAEASPAAGHPVIDGIIIIQLGDFLTRVPNQS